MPSIPLSFKQHKFKVAPSGERHHRGRTWDSKAEMRYVQQLEMLKEAGEIIDFCSQPLVILSGDIHYRPDFIVIEKDDAYYVDVKGVVTERFRVIQKLWPETQRLRLKVLKYKNKKFTEASSK